MDEPLQLRVHGDAALPTLIYLPGLHGDWTLIDSFRKQVEGRARFVEFTYPRTLTWSLEDYAAAIAEALVRNRITTGWLLAESYGSQVAWPLVKRAKGERRIANPGTTPMDSPFTPLGLILAGGFVRHPMNRAVRGCARLGRDVPLRWITAALFGYAKFARIRHRRAPETLANIDRFIARRTELDRQAAVHRLRQIADNDPRPIALAASVPVFQLTGFWDPIVPWPPVRRWLRRHCPALRDSRVILRADHNVLSTAPREAAEQVLAWMTGESNR